MKSVLLNGINLVCTVAKHSSLTSAARELNLTTGAVSQQIQLIEERLGFNVFERHARGIRLTEKGDKLVQSVTPHLLAIEENTYKLTHVSDSKQIRLKLTPSLAFKWLVPRLDDFQKRHPDIQIHTFAEGALVDSDSRDYDIAIDYGPLPYKLPDAELLMAESLLPVMSSEYFRHFSHLKLSGSAQEWQQVTLLHDAMPWKDSAKDHEWHFWAQQHALKFETHSGHFFNRTDMAMSAAEAGLGIALARMALLGDELYQKRLVAPFPAIRANAGYFIITHLDNPHTRLFKSWLKQQAIND
ncbi:LysR substrate-binding domain-containing protein [Vibrio neptunius]|uniref:LysR family transcriptional regulator n=1 Tax=Vibrio neptunius TaxID=170651 RepID=A0ABS3A436_9VIBR|nr:LysR substrate-binding domain-containing protein [Vibrio neptunius]MBN3493898.1 LysR family transcriptional regulator [Vibrio neptunius]MBN3516394.1 LysR family transcriptional regulator [Vibrio neptunius]MBN3550634.1 LysR family transcriptional regulator [Vibrio neptunius]MBN3578765.1 LysR family transcriptional regulator [Vibrio neptunius]MCH9872430.1 LysR family transcriptional regulator [Vibrio neptunius]